jgi:UDP-glucose 6-dehydrogenase
VPLLGHTFAGSGPASAQATNNGNTIGHDGHDEESPGPFDLSHAPNLFFTTDMALAIAEADLIFICVNTPTKDSGIGKDYACDLKYFEAATRKIAEVAVSDKIVVEKSTVPCRTAQSMREIVSGVHQSPCEEFLQTPTLIGIPAFNI